MKKEEIEEISTSVMHKLDMQRTIDIQTHRKHHEYIDSLILDTERRSARKEQMIRVASAWGLVLILTTATAAFWQYLKSSINGN